MHGYSAGCSSKAQFIPPLGHYMLEKRMWRQAGKPVSITHCSRLRQAGGSPGWFPLRNTRRWKRGDFFFFLTAVSPSLCFAGLGSPLAVSQRWGNAEGPVTGRAVEELV